jgi:hypothetical protein
MACCCGQAGCCYPSSLTATISGLPNAISNESQAWLDENFGGWPPPADGSHPPGQPPGLAFPVTPFTQIEGRGNGFPVWRNIGCLNGDYPLPAVSQCGFYEHTKGVQGTGYSFFIFGSRITYILTDSSGRLRLTIAKNISTSQFGIVGNISLPLASIAIVWTFSKVVDCTDVRQFAGSDMCCDDVIRGTYSATQSTAFPLPDLTVVIS